MLGDQLLVSGRSCGDCTVCCEVLPIDGPELRKTSGVLCVHCRRRSGCTIYETRPDVCRGYHCGWRMMDELDDSWRPDRSGILVEFSTGRIPAGYEPPGFELMLLGPRDAILRPAAADFVASLVRQHVPVFLALPGPVGFHPAKRFVNPELAASAEAGNRGALVAAMAAALEGLRGQAFEPVRLGG